MFEGLHCGICALQILSQFVVLSYWDLSAPGKLLQDAPAPKPQVGFPRKGAPLVLPLDLGQEEHVWVLKLADLAQWLDGIESVAFPDPEKEGSWLGGVGSVALGQVEVVVAHKSVVEVPHLYNNDMSKVLLDYRSHDSIPVNVIPSQDFFPL